MVPCPTCYLLYSSLTYQKAHRLTPSKAIFETQKPWLTIATKGVVHFQMKTPWFEGVFWGWCVNDRVEWQIPRVELWWIISVVGALSFLACIPQLLWWWISLYIFFYYASNSNLVFPTLSNTTSALQFVNLVDDWNHKLSTAHLQDQPTHPVWHVNLRAP